MIDDNDRAWMREAINLAKTKGTAPQDTPIAAIILLNGRELSRPSTRPRRLATQRRMPK